VVLSVRGPLRSLYAWPAGLSESRDAHPIKIKCASSRKFLRDYKKHGWFGSSPQCHIAGNNQEVWHVAMCCLYVSLTCGVCNVYCNNVVSMLLGVLSPVPPTWSPQTVCPLPWSHHLHSVPLVLYWQVHGAYQPDSNGPSGSLTQNRNTVRSATGILLHIPIPFTVLNKNLAQSDIQNLPSSHIWFTLHKQACPHKLLISWHELHPL
jgi:hypothetical protein